MHNTPLISVIIPAYNAEKTIDKCVQSLLNQTYKNLEIILVDDCSSDNTPGLCDNFSLQYPNIITIHLTQNSGPSQARNIGMKRSIGEWITFVDSDDWIEPETYQTALKYAEKYSAKHVIWSYVSEYNQTVKEKHIYDSDIVFKGENANDIFYDVLGPTKSRLAHPEFIHSLSVIWCKLFSRKIIERNQLVFYDLDKIGIEDLFFSAQYLNCLSEETSVYIDKCYYHYIKANQNSVSAKYKPFYTQKTAHVINELEKLVKNRNDKDKCMEALSNRRALSFINIGLNESFATDGAYAIVRRLKKVLKDPKIHQAFKLLNFNYLPIKWKLFFFSAKLKLAVPVYILLKIMILLMEKKD